MVEHGSFDSGIESNDFSEENQPQDEMSEALKGGQDGMPGHNPTTMTQQAWESAV